MNRRSFLIASTLAATLLATPALAQSWRDNPAVKDLYEKAKKEGEVMVWGTNGTEVDWIPTAFGKVFSGINVKVLGDNDIATKAIAEARAGRNEVDVFWSSLGATVPVFQRDLVATVDWSPFGVNKDNIGLDGKMAYTSNIVYVVAYNSKLVNAADTPKYWTDLLDAKYKDKMAASSFLMPRMIGALGLKWGEEKAIQYARDMRDKTGLILTRAPREQMLVSGERVYAVAEVNQLPQQWKRDGGPVEYVIPEPVILGQFGATVMAKAPHPNAARLMAGWMATPEGKQARQDATFAADFRPGSTHPPAQKLYASGAVIIHDTVERMKDRDALATKINPVISGQAR